MPIPQVITADHGLGRRSIVRALAGVLGGSMLIALAAQLAIPIQPISDAPLTLQTLAVLLVGFVLGPRLGPAAVIAYLAEGAAGLPVFAGGGVGLAHLAGPTGGYLLGFVPAAALAGRVASLGGGRSPAAVGLAALGGHAVILIVGAAWLAVAIGPGLALTRGLLPFVPAALAKSIVLAGLVPVLLGHRGGRRRDV